MKQQTNLLKNLVYLSSGMSLIEIMIYTALLSLLLTNMISYSYGIHTQQMSLNDDLYDAQNR